MIKVFDLLSKIDKNRGESQGDALTNVLKKDFEENFEEAVRRPDDAEDFMLRIFPDKVDEVVEVLKDVKDIEALLKTKDSVKIDKAYSKFLQFHDAFRIILADVDIDSLEHRIQLELKRNDYRADHPS
jgi:hypothetical protein